METTRVVSKVMCSVHPVLVKRLSAQIARINATNPNICKKYRLAINDSYIADRFYYFENPRKSGQVLGVQLSLSAFGDKFHFGLHSTERFALLARRNLFWTCPNTRRAYWGHWLLLLLGLIPFKFGSLNYFVNFNSLV